MPQILKMCLNIGYYRYIICAKLKRDLSSQFIWSKYHPIPSEPYFDGLASDSTRCMSDGALGGYKFFCVGFDKDDYVGGVFPGLFAVNNDSLKVAEVVELYALKNNWNLR